MILLVSTKTMLLFFMHDLGCLFGSCVLETSIYNSSGFSKVPKTTGKILPDQHWRSVFYHKKNERYVKMKVKLKNQIYAIFKSRLLLCCFMQMVFVLKYINRKESKLS